MTGKEAKERLEKQYKRQNEHIKENYDRVSITLPKGTKERIKKKGETVNGYYKTYFHVYCTASLFIDSRLFQF